MFTTPLFGTMGFDRTTGQSVGTYADAETRFDPLSGVVDHKASAQANNKEALFDALGLIPGVGTVANAGRGVFNMLTGMLTGNQADTSAGMRQIGMGFLYGMPGIGQLAAGLNLGKDLSDSAQHSMAASQQDAIFGGYQNQRDLARSMMLNNTGMSLGMYSQPSPGYWAAPNVGRISPFVPSHCCCP